MKTIEMILIGLIVVAIAYYFTASESPKPVSSSILPTTGVLYSVSGQPLSPPVNLTLPNHIVTG